VLRRIFGLIRTEMKGDWNKLHIEELHNFYYSSYIVRMIESIRRVRRAGHVVRMREEMHTTFWLENLQETTRMTNA
jgi:hypothetical protein